MDDDCPHDWEFVNDWYGNPDVPNGTMDCSYYYCPLCDTEQTDTPEGYEQPFQEPYDGEDF